MQDWERAFSAKSERRRRRVQLHTLIRRIALLALLTVIIGVAMYAINTLVAEFGLLR